MKTLKKEDDRKIRLSISISPDIKEKLENKTSNRSRYIELSLYEYFNSIGIDVKKIKL